MEGRQAEIGLGLNPIYRKQQFVEPQLLHRLETLVMGIELRDRFQRAPELPQLWSQFLTEPALTGQASTEPRRADGAALITPQTVYAVYTDYTSDRRASSLILASRVCNIDNPPEHQVGIAIPAGRYLVFEASGSPADMAMRSWQQVRSYFQAESSYQRAFTTDFELYEPQQTTVYIAVKSELVG